MPAGDAREALLRVAGRLSVDLGYPEGEEDPDAVPFMEARKAPGHILDPEDELLVTGVRRGLSRLAEGLGVGEQAEATQMLVGAALDGAEMTMRSELMRGGSEHLPALLPSFVFLVALPIVHHDKAFKLSRRTLQMLEEARRES